MVIIHPDLELDVRRVVLSSTVNIDARSDDETSGTLKKTLGVSRYLTGGTGSGQADAYWSDTRSVSAGSNDDIDLTAVVSELGFSAVKSIQVEVLSTSGVLLVGKVGSVTNGWDGPFHSVTGCYQRVEAEGCWANHCTGAGWTVDATHKVLRVNNPGAASVSYRITLVGVAE